ncbi:aspartate kinase [Balneola sp. MJW-20]|uniref:aspartate kinase n=1 Tax=Gracilimonas aurantiaca TaxID=3234185 RepID=UPI00346741B6
MNSSIEIHVLKFGGTSMNDHQTWKKVLEIISEYEYPIVVVSATARTTRQLVQAGKLASSGDLEDALKISNEISVRHKAIVHSFLEENPSDRKDLIWESCIKKVDEKVHKLNKLLSYAAKEGALSPQMNDAIMSIGEQISSYLLAQCGLAAGLLTQHVDARKLIMTDNRYGNANPNLMLINQKCGSLETMMEDGFTPVIGGFYGESAEGNISTLGFEGSDYTASLIGAAVHAKTIEIWTDVSGVYTSDPRYIPDARPLEELSYFDATEMAYFGAKVLHPSTLKPAQERNIPVSVKNMFKPEEPGTRIIRDSKGDPEVLAMAFKPGITILTISAYETLMGYDFLTRVFEVLKKYRLPVDAVNTTEASVTIALSNSEILDRISNDFIEIGTVQIISDKGLISLIGCRISEAAEISKKVLNSLNGQSIDLISFSKEKRILNLVLDEDKLVESAQKIHEKIFNT